MVNEPAIRPEVVKAEVIFIEARCNDGQPCLQEMEWGHGCPRNVDGTRYDCNRGQPDPHEHCCADEWTHDPPT